MAGKQWLPKSWNGTRKDSREITVRKPDDPEELEKAIRAWGRRTGSIRRKAKFKSRFHSPSELRYRVRRRAARRRKYHKRRKYDRRY
jgi:hypothetical protein